MLVTCPGCSSRYRLAQDREPPQGARLRCPKCDRVFAVGADEMALTSQDKIPQLLPGAPRTSGGAGHIGREQTPIGPDPFYSQPTPGPTPESRPAVLAARIRLANRSQGDRPLLVTHGFGLGATVPHDETSSRTGGPSDALLALTVEDMRAIAEDLVMAIAANHADLVARARQDHRWDAHLGPIIREVWADFQACVGSAPSGGEQFRAALNNILAQGHPIF